MTIIGSAAAPIFGKKKLLLVFVLGLILTVVSSIPTTVRNVSWACPEWSLMLVLYLAFRVSLTQACLAALLLGCVQDAINISPEGMESLALMTTAIALRYVFGLAQVKNFAFLIVFVTAASVFKNVIFIPVLFSVMGLDFDISGRSVLHWLVKAGLTGFSAIPVLSFLDYLSSKAEEKR
ncbi:MAG: rod shape-determining protein MreD [Deltaproteobacteria bacterium]|nr:rod shape-determining protein MreD [Deltaproteobacteria bacterium]